MSFRRLPPLNALATFEAVARHRSFTKAAKELCVTQGAVSRHVAALESELAAKHFIRRHRAIDLTPKGESYFRALRDAFERIADATEHVTGVPDPAHQAAADLRLPLDRAAVRAVLEAAGTSSAVLPSLPAGLTERELDVLRLLGTELGGPDIARTLVVSLNTVRTHTSHIYAKLGVTNRRAAVRRAAELDLLSRQHR